MAMPYRLPRRRRDDGDYRDEDWFDEQNRTNTGISGHGFPNGVEPPPIVTTGPNTTMADGRPTMEDAGRRYQDERGRAIRDFMGRQPSPLSNEGILRGAYTNFLGRPADEEGLASHLGNPGGLEGALGSIYDSEEGAAFRNRPTPPPTTTGTGTTGTTGPGRRGWAGTSGTGLNLDMPTSRGGYGTLEGFNTTRAFAGGDEGSVKDAFARWITGLGFDPARASKEEIEAVLRANMESAAEYGLNILDVDGENILIETRERGPEWVDVVRGAGAGPGDPDAAWWWGADGGGGGGGGGEGGGGGGMFGLPDLGGDLPPELLDAAGGEGNLLARIRAELDALVNGTPSPMGRTALTSQLKAL